MPTTFNVQATEAIEQVEKATINLEVCTSVAGAKADSSYQIAKRHGYTGTEQDFLNEYIYSGNGFYNLDALHPLNSGNYTLTTAVAKVVQEVSPTAKQRDGMIIQFFDGTAWRYFAYQLEYKTGSETEQAQFANTANWLEFDGNTVYFQEGVSLEDMEVEYERILRPLYQALTDAETEIDRAQSATSAAQSATTSAGDAALIANQKAGLANDAATFANQKAELANTKAGLADTKAQYADEMGDYAKAKADEIEDAKGTYGTLGARIDALESNIEDVQDVIPSQATSSNQLADKDFVNSSIATATATFRGTYNLVTDLHFDIYAPQSEIANALSNIIQVFDNNDYAFVQVPTSTATPLEIARIDRYKSNGQRWAFEYSLNNSSFTAAQWAAINSGITSALVTSFGAKYDKPSGGIPKTDLASAVQTSLGKADTAIQSSDISTVAVFVEENTPTWPFN